MPFSHDAARRERAIYRITLVGSVCNLLLTVFKFVAGIAGHSAAMLADAVHSLTDLVSDFIVLVMVHIAGLPQDCNHEYGHGKFESLATVAIGLLLLAAGLGIGWQGTVAVWQYAHGQALSTPEPVALWAALVSIAVKEALYWYTIAGGRRYRSHAVEANAWHHRSDALSSVGTALGVGGALLLGPAWAVLDPLAALVVCIFIVRAAIALMIPAFNELLDRSLPEAEEQFIRQTILAEPGVSDPHHLRTRSIGHYCAIEVHLRMEGSTTIDEAHRAVSRIEARLRLHFGPTTIINTHIEPVKHPEAAVQVD